MSEREIRPKITSHDRSATPKRLMRGMDALLAFPFKRIDVRYQSDGENINPDAQYIFAVSHKTGWDTSVAIKALGDWFNLAIADQSTHHTLGREANMLMLLKAAGSENFIPISYEWVNKAKKPIFNPSDVNPMVDAMESGKSIIMAAHNPSDEIERQDINKVNPGYGAALLAHLTGAQIIPVSVEVSEPDQLGRKNASVLVGDPYDLGYNPEMADIQAFMDKRANGEPLSTQERQLFLERAASLRKSGRAVLDSVAKLDEP